MEERIKNVGQLVFVASSMGAGFGALAGLAPYTAGAPIGVVYGGASIGGFAILGICLSVLLRSVSPKPQRKFNNVTTTVTTWNEDGSHAQRSTFESCDDWQLRALARGLLIDGKDFTEDTWTRRSIPFDRFTFKQMRAEMLRRHWAQQKGATIQRGVELTDHGRESLARMIRFEIPPLPTEDVYTYEQ